MSEMMRGAAPGIAQEARCRLCMGILGVSLERPPLLKNVAIHMDQAHPEVGPLMLEGHHFELAVAPHRCDICCAATEPPWWTYTTPRHRNYLVEDPEWLVCEGCHAIIRDNPGKAMQPLLERSVRQQLENTAGAVGEEVIRRHLRSAIGGFLVNIKGDPVRS